MGMGLGLSICHWVASAHGGLIDVVSTPGRGSKFRVALPRDESAKKSTLGDGI
jgi:signal transduction histidine kinase